jgi:hypothetical protein
MRKTMRMRALFHLSLAFITVSQSKLRKIPSGVMLDGAEFLRCAQIDALRRFQLGQLREATEFKRCFQSACGGSRPQRMLAEIGTWQ